MHPRFQTVAVCGAGTMGSGIAQVTAMHGYRTVLFDVNSKALEKASNDISRQLQQLEDKGRITREQKEKAIQHITFTTDVEHCKADLVIEAIAEIAEIKTALFRTLVNLNTADTIFATNTSSLSVTTIAESTTVPEQFCGLHFFNPAPLMKLVEIVKTTKTKPGIIQSIYEFAIDINKTPVICTDTPGFIVNRIARHYYLESLKLVEEDSVSMEDLDRLLESAGFRMGPFRLMDFIGNDVNLAVTESLYNASGKMLRFKPSALQKGKVEKGELGKKTGRGFYNYPTDK